MIGTQIANYRIEERLGEGGMGVVYKAVDVNLDRTVALKFLASDLNRDPGLIERFQAEAKAQANLNHTNIATLYNFINVDGNWLIAMEYVDGENLEQLIQRTKVMQYQDAVAVFKQALLGIGFAHRFGIVHRDIKPANIMINRHGIVKVMDFGIAKALSGRKLTRTGVAVGTVAYMSPEQIRNQNVDIRSDIYSLGITLYQMLTAHLPFESDSDFQVQYDHVNTPPPPLSLYYPYIPPGIEAAVLRAVEKDPANRFRTVEEFGAALEHPDVVPAQPFVAVAGTGVPVKVSEPQAGVQPGRVSSPAMQPTVPARASGEYLEQAQPPASSRLASGFWSSKNLMIAAVAGLVFVTIIALAIWKRPHQTEALRSSSSLSSGGTSSPITQSPQQGQQQSSASQPMAALELPSATEPDVTQQEKSQQTVAQPKPKQTERPQPRQTETSQPQPKEKPQILMPAGTSVMVRLDSDFNSDDATVGQLLPATVVNPVASEGNVLVQSGASAQLQVVDIDKAGKISGKPHVRFALVELTARGKLVKISGASNEVDGPSQGGRAAERAGLIGAAGAVVGGITGRMFHHAASGAALGAGAGGTAGLVTAHPAPVKVNAETVLSFRLTRSISIGS